MLPAWSTTQGQFRMRIVSCIPMWEGCRNLVQPTSDQYPKPVKGLRLSSSMSMRSEMWMSVTGSSLMCYVFLLRVLFLQLVC